MIGSRTTEALAVRAAEMGRMSLRCKSPADSVLAMVLQDVGYLFDHATEDHALELAVALGREVIDWCKRHYSCEDQARMEELLDFVMEELLDFVIASEGKKHG